MLTKEVKYLRILPPYLGRLCKLLLVYPRFWRCKYLARASFLKHGNDYLYKVIFVAGMPKSGTTWLEKMLSSYPGYEELLIPCANLYELKTGESHLYDLPNNFFSKLSNCLCLTKMHCHGSMQNVKVLADAKIPYVILYRDPRDISVSHYFYVLNTPWHGDYPCLKNCSVQQGIVYFIEKRLAQFAHWMRSWRDNRDPQSSVMFSYEEMLDDSVRIVRKVLDMYELDYSPELVEKITERNSFSHLKGKQAQSSNFFRSGKSGDWRNYYSQDLKDRFKAVDNEILLEFGYEEGDQW